MLKRASLMGKLIALCASPLTILAGGCASVQPARVIQFQQSADTVHTQAQITFRAIDDFVTEDEIRLVVTKGALAESDVAVMLPPSEIGKWEKAFSAVDSYCKSLSALLDPALATDTENSIVAAATELKALDKNALPDPIISTAFTQVGGLLIEAKAQGDALKTARSADPAMQVIFSAMAHAIGSDGDEPGLIKTVSEHWTDRMAARENLFHRNFDAFRQGHPKPSDDDTAAFETSQRQVVLGYIQLRDQRDANLLALTSLRKSLLGLAEAHSALARGSSPDLSATLSKLQAELDAAKALHEQFKAIQQPTTNTTT